MRFSLPQFAISRSRLDAGGPRLSRSGLALWIGFSFAACLAIATALAANRLADASAAAETEVLAAAELGIGRGVSELRTLDNIDSAHCDEHTTRELARLAVDSWLANAFFIDTLGDGRLCGVAGIEPIPAARFLETIHAAGDDSTGDGSLVLATATDPRNSIIVARAAGGRRWTVAEIHPQHLRGLLGLANEKLVVELSDSLGRPLLANVDGQHRSGPVLWQSQLKSANLSLTANSSIDARMLFDATLRSIAPWSLLALALAIFVPMRFNQRLAARGSPERRMRQAIRKRRFEPVVQPIVCVDTGHCIGVEVLMRWRHPTRGLLAPAEFIDLAEQTGLIVEMSDIIMRKARDQLAPIVRARPGMYVSFNVTSAQLRDPEFATRATGIFDAVSLAPQQVILELTERELVDPRGMRSLEQLRASGFRIAMDDFGTGESSLAVLQTLSFDRIKIDREFVRTIDSTTTSRPILDTVIRLGRDLGVPLIAEGIETQAQWDYLVARGVQSVQGYLIARPMRIDDFGSWLDARRQSMSAASDACPSQADPAPDHAIGSTIDARMPATRPLELMA